MGLFVEICCEYYHYLFINYDGKPFWDFATQTKNILTYLMPLNFPFSSGYSILFYDFQILLQRQLQLLWNTQILYKINSRDESKTRCMTLTAITQFEFSYCMLERQCLFSTILIYFVIRIRFLRPFIKTLRLSPRYIPRREQLLGHQVRKIKRNDLGNLNPKNIIRNRQYHLN